MNSPNAYQMLLSVFNNEPVLNVVLMRLYCDNPTLGVIGVAMCVQATRDVFLYILLL